MAEGAILGSMVHSGEEFGFSIKIEECHNFFDMMGDVDLGVAHGLKVMFCCIAQRHDGIAVLKEGGIGF